ncbi:MAG: hypothetical protein AAGI69_03385 [Cyanobacteria bacterium P01_H01_bin.21]
MSRLSRRSPRVKPPLRGRAVTKHYRGEFAPVASVRRPLTTRSPALSHPGRKLKPPISTSPPFNPCPPPKIGLHAKLVKFYQHWVKLLRSLNQPWQWLLAVVIVLSSLILLSQLK